MNHKLESKKMTIRHIKTMHREVLALMASVDDIEIDMTDVDEVDTSGLAVILSWWRYALEHEVKCHFIPSEQVKSLMAIYDIELPV